MEYSEGKIIEELLREELREVKMGQMWIIKAMRDNDFIPAEEKEEKKKKGA